MVKRLMLSPPSSGIGPGPRGRSRLPVVTGEKSRPRPLGRGRFPIAKGPAPKGRGSVLVADRPLRFRGSVRRVILRTRTTESLGDDDAGGDGVTKLADDEGHALLRCAVAAAIQLLSPAQLDDVVLSGRSLGHRRTREVVVEDVINPDAADFRPNERRGAF